MHTWDISKKISYMGKQLDLYVAKEGSKEQKRGFSEEKDKIVKGIYNRFKSVDKTNEKDVNELYDEFYTVEDYVFYMSIPYIDSTLPKEKFIEKTFENFFNYLDMVDTRPYAFFRDRPNIGKQFFELFAEDYGKYKNLGECEYGNDEKLLQFRKIYSHARMANDFLINEISRIQKGEQGSYFHLAMRHFRKNHNIKY